MNSCAPLLIVVVLLPLAGCGGPDVKSDAQFQADIVSQMNDFLAGKARALGQAAVALRDAAPTPVGRGWDASDQPAIDAMKTAWQQMRSAWEAAEGALASLFVDLDGVLDTRYEEFLATLGPGGDSDLFDAQGVTGMHAIERILFAADTPAAVVMQESLLPGYVAAAWPATQEQSDELKAGLLTEIVNDTQLLTARLSPGAIDLSSTFKGLTELMDEQKQKVTLAGSHVDESRYAQRTLADLRDNLAGTMAAYAFFVPWLNSKPNGLALDGQVQMAFDRLVQTYQTIDGNAIPEPPPGWNSRLPTIADQATPFGQLYVAVVREVDPTYTGSAVDAMNHVASMLGLPVFTGAE